MTPIRTSYGFGLALLVAYFMLFKGATWTAIPVAFVLFFLTAWML